MPLRLLPGTLVTQTDQKRESYAQTVGEDGFALLDWVESVEAPTELRQLQQVAILRTVWDSGIHLLIGSRISSFGFLQWSARAKKAPDRQIDSADRSQTAG
jgi:hypothetical protein